MDLNTVSWFLFIFLILMLIKFDLGFFNKSGKKLSLKKNIYLSIFYIFISFLFSFYVFYLKGQEAFHQYLTGYLLEKGLAFDNIFVIALIFKYFKVPSEYQKRVLFWGILGAIFFRAILIGFGAVMIQNFSWILYVFGVILIAMGIKMLFPQKNEADFSNSIILKGMSKIINIFPKILDDSFFIKNDMPMKNKLIKNYSATPLFVSLVFIEFVDFIFAIDSVPAIFSITTDLYIVYTSNIFAILGLRSLYFVLEKMVSKFTYLHYALAVLLIFIGLKTFIVEVYGKDVLNTKIVLILTFSILILGILPTYLKKNRTSI